MYKVYQEAKDDDKDEEKETILPLMDEGEKLSLKEINKNQQISYIMTSPNLILAIHFSYICFERQTENRKLNMILNLKWLLDMGANLLIDAIHDNRLILNI